MHTKTFVEQWVYPYNPGDKILLKYEGGLYNIIMVVEDCEIYDNQPSEFESFYICEQGAYWGLLPRCSYSKKERIDSSSFQTQLTIDEDIIIGDINIGLSIYQNNIGSLQAYLVSPENLSVQLFSNVGGLGDHMGLIHKCSYGAPDNCPLQADDASKNFTDFTSISSGYSRQLDIVPLQSRLPYFLLDDTSNFGLESSRAAYPPFERRSFRPEDSFEDLIGTNAKGDWTLVIEHAIDNWIHEPNGFMADAPPVKGEISSIYYTALVEELPVTTQTIYYIGEDNQIHKLTWSDGYWGTQQWQHQPIGELAGAPLAHGTPIEFSSLWGSNRVYYTDANGAVHYIYFNGSKWVHDDLSQRGSVVKGNLVVSPQNPDRIYFRNQNDQLESFAFTMLGLGISKIGEQLSAPKMTGDPSVVRTNGDVYIVYKGSDGEIHLISYENGWSRLNISDITNAHPAANDPVIHALYSEELGFSMNVFYEGYDGHLHELLYWEPYPGAGLQWAYIPTGEAIGAPKIAGKPSTVKTADGSQHIYYRGLDNSINYLHWNGSKWEVEITNEHDGAPSAAGDPIGMVIDEQGAQTVYYPGTDNQVHSVYKIDPNSVENGELWNWLIDIEPMPAADPVIKVNGSTENYGEFLGPVSIDLSSINVPAATAVISYTLDGSNPNQNSAIFDGAIQVDVTNGQPSQTFVIKAQACCNGYAESRIIGKRFTVWAEQAAAPAVHMQGDESGTNQFRNEVTVSLGTPTPQSVIRYTLDGSEPTDSSPAFNGTPMVFKLAEGEDQKQIVIKTKAFRPDYMDSPVTTQSITLTRDYKVFIPMIHR